VASGIDKNNLDFKKIDSKLITNNLPQGVASSNLIPQLLNKKVIEIKSNLIPLVLNLIKEFGISEIEKYIKNPTDIKCMSDAKITEIIKKRNNLVKKLNLLYSTVNLAKTTVASTETILTALKIAINLITVAPIPLQFATAGVVITLKESQDEAKKLLSQLTALTGTAAGILIIFATTIKQLIDLLNLLDNLLRKCSTTNNIPYEQINSDILNLLPDQSSLNPDINPTENFYKGFTISVITEDSPLSLYPRRQAIAANKLGVVVLKGPLSFSSDPEVLINEIKYIIDSQDLKSN
jgi:hypothetical protein